VRDELRITTILNLKEVVPHFTYRCERGGVVEYEFCPIWTGYLTAEPVPNPVEVADVTWMSWEALVRDVAKRPARYSEWCIWEVEELSRQVGE
jgi:isopentenyl-diphosphate delta-isomerase